MKLYCLFVLQVTGGNKHGEYKNAFIVSDSRIRQIEQLWPLKFKDERPTLVSQKNLNFDELDEVVNTHCDFSKDEKNLLVCSLGIHDILKWNAIDCKDCEANERLPLLLPVLNDLPVNDKIMMDQIEEKSESNNKVDETEESTETKENDELTKQIGENIENDEDEKSNDPVESTEENTDSNEPTEQTEETEIKTKEEAETDEAKIEVKNEAEAVTEEENVDEPEVSIYTLNHRIAERIIDQMKSLRDKMKADSIDVVFTDVFGVDICKMQYCQLQLNKCEECSCYAMSESIINAHTNRVNEILSLVNTGIIDEKLNKLEGHWSKWVLLPPNPDDDYFFNDGINLNKEYNIEIKKKISKLLYQCGLDKEVLEKKTQSRQRNRKRRSRNYDDFVPAVRAYRTYKRVIIAGDYWLEPVVDMWPRDDVLKPTFAILNKLGVVEIVDKLEEKYDLNNTLIILSVGTDDVFEYVEHDDCTFHRPLKFPVVQNSILKSPAAFAGRLWARMSSLKNRIQKQYKGTHIVYLTVYPMNLIAYLNFILQEHEDKYRHKLPPLLDQVTQSRVTKNLPIAFQQVNMWINENSQTDQLPTWGINKILNVKGSEKTIVFPEVNVKVSVANKVITKFQTLIEQSNPIDDNAIYEAEVRKERGETDYRPTDRWTESKRNIKSRISRSPKRDVRDRLSRSSDSRRYGAG